MRTFVRVLAYSVVTYFGVRQTIEEVCRLLEPEEPVRRIRR